MTAEVGVLNRIGVALAADSAVSIGYEADKIWTSADKLFQLAHSAPVGIMVYGNAAFVGIPWETVVKEFRADLADTRFDHLQEYADHFFSFLAKNRKLFPLPSQDLVVSALVTGLFHFVRDTMRDRLTKEAEERDGLSEDEIAPIVDDVVSKFLHNIRDQSRLAGFDKTTVDRIRRRYGSDVRRFREDTFGSLPITSGTSRKIASIALEMLTRRYLGPAQSGVVIAGFGEREGMPSLFGFDIEEMASNAPRYFQTKEHQITLQNGAVIVPFAQQETVHAFLRGVDVSLASHMRHSTSTLDRKSVV